MSRPIAAPLIWDSFKNISIQWDIGYMNPFYPVIISAILLVVSFPKFYLGFLAWIALVPIMLSITGRGLFKSFYISLSCGTLFFAGIFYWLMNVPKYTLLYYAILMPYFGVFFGLFGLIFSLISKRLGIVPAYIAAPFVWITLDFVRSHFFWLALPWGMLAHSQYQYLPVIQIASYTGAYGISFLIVLVNSSLSLIAITYSSRLQKLPGIDSIKLDRKAAIGMICATAVIVILSVIYGIAATTTPIKGDPVKVAVVQANIDQTKKWDKNYAGFILRTYADLTLKAAESQPALIAWPETATPAALNADVVVRYSVYRIAMKAGIPLLLGSAERRKYEKQISLTKDYTNAAYLINPRSGALSKQRYDKIKLLPFGEYVPARKSIAWRILNIEPVLGYSPGKEYTVFQLPPYQFSAPICWENIFPNLFRQFVKEGAQFMVNITNAGFFGRSAAPYQVVSMVVFRAVENRVFVVRAANTGVSCFIDPHGRIVDRLQNEKGEDIFIQGVLTGTVIPQDSKTFYTLHGDVFAWLCVIVSLAILLLAVFKRNKGFA